VLCSAIAWSAVTVLRVCQSRTAGVPQLGRAGPWLGGSHRASRCYGLGRVDSINLLQFSGRASEHNGWLQCTRQSCRRGTWNARLQSKTKPKIGELFTRVWYSGARKCALRQYFHESKMSLGSYVTQTSGTQGSHKVLASSQACKSLALASSHV
jgi:hypothetical protein